MAPSAAVKSGGGSKKLAGGAKDQPQLRDRKPTLLQTAVVAVYVYFIPFFVAVNVALLFSRWTAALWLL